MKIACLLLSSLMMANLAVAATPQIEVEICFIEIHKSVVVPDKVSWNLDTSESREFAASDMTNILLKLENSGAANLLSFPKLRTQSGTNATVKVVTECRYPTAFDVCPSSVTNGTNIVRGIAVVPSNFETRDVGTTLNVKPVLDAKRNVIHLELMAELVSEPSWQEYPAIYEGSDGTRRTMALPQPIFHVRRVTQSLSLHNNATVVMSGLISTGTKRVEDRVPLLGAIPWLGRLFRSSRELNERRNLLITVTTRTIGDRP